jgi:RNA polymerase sigma factor for flagellar operon FliA
MKGAQLPAPAGEALFLSQLADIERVISFVSARYHLPGVEADDFESHVKLKLIEDDYQILGRFEGRSSLRTYLTIVIQRLFLDYRTHAWGKWRPSAEATRGGAVAVLLERLTNRDGHGFEEACELMETNHQVTVPRSALEAIAGRLPVRMRRRFESDEALADLRSDEPSVDDVIAERERAAIAVRLGKALKAALAGLGPQDRLIVAMQFHDGRTLADIARMLRLDQKALYRRSQRLMKELRSALEAQGINGVDALQIFQSPTVSIDWSDRSEETPQPCPSMEEGNPT